LKFDTAGKKLKKTTTKSKDSANETQLKFPHSKETQKYHTTNLF
jgi:hypothetical protein